MEKCKKTMSLMLALSMVMASAVTVAHAEETTDKIVMKTVDLADYYNRPNVYRSDLSKVKYNDDGSVMTNADGVIQQTGISGSAGYAGSFYYDYFIKDQDTYTWKTPWTDDMTVNTLTTKSGTEFKLKVADGYTAPAESVAWSNYEAMGKVTKDEAFTTFDVEDGYYSTLKLLANTNYSGASSSMLVKLNYADGSEVSLKGLNYFANKVNDDADKDADGNSIAVISRRVRSITSAELTAGVTELTPEMLDGNGYIGEYSVIADKDKKLVSFGLLNSNYYLTTDAETGEYITDTSGEYVIAECAKKEDGTYELSADKRPHSTLLYAATLLTTESLELKNLKDNIEAEINALSDDLSYDDLAEYEAIQEKIDSYVALGGSTGDFDSYSVFEEKYAAVKLLEEVSIPYDMTGLYNVGRIYTSEFTNGGGNAGYSGSFYYNDFISDKFITWKTPWSELSEGTIDNTLISNGVEFDLRVVDWYTDTTTNCVWWNSSTNANVDDDVFTTFDVTDGKYKSFEILTNSDKDNGNYIVVKLNYSNNTYTIKKYEVNSIANGVDSEAVATVASTRTWGEAETPEDLADTTARPYTWSGKIGHFSIPADETKTLVSVSIVNDNYTLEIAEDGTYTATKIENYTSNSRYSQSLYAAAVYAMTLVSTKGEVIESKKAEIESKLNELPDFDSITTDDAELIEEIGVLIEEYKLAGGVAENEDFYGTYLYALEMVEGSYPAEINVDLTGIFNRNRVYTSVSDQGPTSAGYPGAFDYASFIGDEYITWVTPWVDGMKENKLISDGHTFKLKVVDSGNADKDLSNVIFWNGDSTVTGEWTNIDVYDGKYNSIEVLANSNRAPGNKNDYSAAEQGKTLIVRLNYADNEGPVILGTNREYELNFFANGGIAPTVASKRNNSTSVGTIRHITIPAEFGRTLESIDILNSGYAIDEDGNVVEDTVRLDVNGEPYKNNTTGEVLTNGTNHNAVIYAMTLVGTKSSVAEVNKDYIAEIEAKIDTLTNSAVDADIMAEIADMLIVAGDRGVADEDISNISKYNAEYPYFAEVSDVTVTNDNKEAEIIFTFDRKLTDDVIEKSSFAIGENALTAEKLSDNTLKVTFAHGMDYDNEWGIAVKLGYATDYNQLVTLSEPAVIENVLFYQGDSVIENFYKTTDGTFRVEADVNAYTDEAVMLALYNGVTLNTVKAATITDGKLTCEFTVADDMDENWVLKSFVWDSVTGMIPQSKVKTLNKTYGYDNFVDLTKDLTVVYFGDSQTQGSYFTTPLTNALEVQREDTGATVTGVNAGQGGTAINLGMYRLDDEVIAHNPDVVFIEFFPNDSNISSQGATTEAALAKDAQLVAYHENVIKRLLSLDHVPVIIYMNPMKEPDSNGVVYNYYALDAIDDLLAYYGIPVMDFQEEAERLIETGDYTWDDFRISSSNVHFTSNGGQICAEWMYKLMTDSATKDSYVKTANLGLADYQTVQYEHPQMISSKYGVYDDKWEITSLATVTEGYENPVSGDAFPNEYMAATEVGAEMTFKFKGTSLYIYTLIGAYGGKAEFEIDGIYTGTIDTYSTNSKSMYKSPKLVKSGLEDTEHTVTIRVVEPNSSVKSEKAYFGIGKFMVERN